MKQAIKDFLRPFLDSTSFLECASVILWCLLWAFGLIVIVSMLSMGATAQNIVVVVWDDVGTEDVATVPTPNYDFLASVGANFTQARSHSWCAPTRDGIFRSVEQGQWRSDLCSPNPGPDLSSTPTLAGTLHEVGFRTYLIGKYHNGRAPMAGIPWYFAPHFYGFDHWWAGTSSSPNGCMVGHNRVDNGTFTNDPRHPLEFELESVAQALDDGGGQAFVFLGTRNAHSPWRVPPSHLLNPGFIPNPRTERGKYEAEIAGLDWQLGQIMALLGPEDWLILLGDNGTPEAVAPGRAKAKLTVYERGVRVPMIFAGLGVVPGERYGTVQTGDIAPSIIDGLGLPVPPEWEGVSVVPSLLDPTPGMFPRDYVYVWDSPTGNQAVANLFWKLVVDDGVESMYYIWNDPWEQTPLPAAGPDYDYLKQFLR